MKTCRLFAANFTTGQETELGFIPAEGPLTLADIALADGDYEIRVRSDGSYWRDARHAAAFPLSIEGGEIVAPLPAVTNLTSTRVGDAVLLAWTWRRTAGTQSPRDFAIWTAASEPIDTTNEPDQIVPARQPGGPAATIAIPVPHTPLASPDNQTARFERE